MSITFPTTLDTLSNPSAGDALNNPSHATQHANANDAIEFLEAKVGADASAVTTSHDYKLSGVTGTDKAVSKTGTETLTNKTLTSPLINLASNATGDTYYRDSGGVFQRLAIGTTDQIWTVSGGLPIWKDNPNNTNASNSVKGVVEEATLAEVIAGTATGGTGARLYINPSASLYRFPMQDIPLATGTTSASGNSTSCTSNSDGSILFTSYYDGSTIYIFRLVKDSSTGNYYITHTTTVASTLSRGGMAIIGSYLYVSIYSGGNALRRYAIADLSGVTTINFSGTSKSSSAVWSDETYLYIHSGVDTFDKFTISGTTATNTATITYTSMGTLSPYGSIGNATSVWTYDGTTFKRYPIAGGAATSTLAPLFYAGRLNTGIQGLFFGSTTTLGIATNFNWCSATSVVGIGVNLMAITLP
jgi:hypothetical protein